MGQSLGTTMATDATVTTGGETHWDNLRAY